MSSIPSATLLILCERKHFASPKLQNSIDENGYEFEIVLFPLLCDSYVVPIVGQELCLWRRELSEEMRTILPWDESSSEILSTIFCLENRQMVVWGNNCS